jgi:hypothetical protein
MLIRLFCATRYRDSSAVRTPVAACARERHLAVAVGEQRVLEEEHTPGGLVTVDGAGLPISHCLDLRR